jgi:hypothetical protein
MFWNLCNMLRKRHLLQLENRGSVLHALLLLTLCIAGCSKDATTGHVSGIVRLDGKPLTTGTIRFIPSAGRPATGQIQSDGTFTLGTYGKNDGAIVGLHRVTVVAIQSDLNQADASDRESATRRTTASPDVKSLVPKRYNGPVSSGLTFEVKPGDNLDAEFDLTSR